MAKIALNFLHLGAFCTIVAFPLVAAAGVLGDHKRLAGELLGVKVGAVNVALFAFGAEIGVEVDFAHCDSACVGLGWIGLVV